MSTDDDAPTPEPAEGPAPDAPQPEAPLPDAIDPETDRLYDTRRGVPDADEIIEGWREDAARFRAEWRTASLDVAYGPEPRSDLDVFWPNEQAGDRGSDVPLAMFVHGGYWRRFDRKVFSHLARGLASRGMAVAMPSYTLAPEAAVADIVAQLRQCVRFVFRTYGRRVTVVGHSAGAHLAASLFATDWCEVDPALPADLVPAGLGLSGIYDLVPLLRTSVNETLGLDEEAARAASPIHALPPALRRFDAWVGRRESAAFHEQTRRLARRWSMTGTLSRMHVVPNAHHFSVVAPLANPRSRMVKHVLDLVARPEEREELDDGEHDGDGEEQVEDATVEPQG